MTLIECENVRFVVPTLGERNGDLAERPIKMLVENYWKKAKRSEKVILTNVSFRLKRGERLGVIGKNGSGKSTLLKVVSGIYVPSSGNVKVNGRVAGLFNMQLGMSKDATGIENLYLRGLQMGLSVKEIKKRLDSVIEFAELGQSINEPYGTYSAGMKLRLSISISTLIEPEILILDEWIGAGDQMFKRKVSKRMSSLVESSSGLIIATHSEQLIRELCNKVLLLNNGSSTLFHDIDEAFDAYRNTSY